MEEGKGNFGWTVIDSEATKGEEILEPETNTEQTTTTMSTCTGVCLRVPYG